MSDKKTAQQYVNIWNSLQQGRSTWENHWEDCADYILPRKADMTNSVRTLVRGSKKTSRVFDATAILANEDMASALHGMLTNPSTMWFEIGVPYGTGTNGEINLWLDHATRTMHEVLNGSNFQTQIHELYLDLGCFGTNTTSVEDDVDKVVRFKAQHVGQCWLVENADGMVDTMYRSYMWSADQAYKKFGDSLPDEIMKAYKESSRYEPQWEFLQVVEPRRFYDPKKIDPINMPFRSVSIFPAKATFIGKESGYVEFPFITPRWTTIAGETYGRSPGMKALPDIKMLNRMSESLIRATQKTVDPPMLINNRATLSPLRTYPGGLNYISPSAATARDPVAPLYGRDGIKLPLGWEAENQRRQAIHRAFYLDQLMIQEPIKSHVTALEFDRRTSDRLRRLGPIVGRLESELLYPLISRLFGIVLRRNDILPPPPPGLTQVKVNFISPIAKVQKIEQSDSLMRTVAAAGPLIENNPALLDNLNQDKVFRDISDISNMPQNWLNGEDIVQKIRENRAEMALAEQQKAEALASVEAAAKLWAPASG